MTTIKIDSLQFKKSIKKLLPFASTEETRYCLCGIFLEFDGKEELRATATNGQVLINMRIRLMGQKEAFGEQNKVSGIISTASLKHLAAIISKETGGLGSLVTFEDGKTVLFDFGDIQYRAKLIDGTYPDYSRVIPSGKESLKEGIDASLLMKAMNALGNSPVDILIDDLEHSASAPHLFSKTTADDEDMKCVVMPMRV